MKGTIYRTTKLLSRLAGILMLAATMMIGCKQNVTTPQPAAYTVGKIVLADKTLVEASNYSAIDTSNPPIAIICGTNKYGAALGIALHTSGSDLTWAQHGSTGYNTKFEGIICKHNSNGFVGDMDGSDNWDYIKQQDTAGAADAETNYPAFHWVNTYNTTYADKLGTAKPVWYMPSLAELYEVYKNKDKINASLKTIHDASGGSAYADESLGTNSYWSSSQFFYNPNCTWDVNFGDGTVNKHYKDDSGQVCCLAGF